jgi:GWxTD domain-containing protein
MSARRLSATTAAMIAAMAMAAATAMTAAPFPAPAAGDPASSSTEPPRDPRPGGSDEARIDLAACPSAPETLSDEDLHHYSWILDEEQRGLYRAGDEPARREIVRVAFAALDATPVTPENERREEHFRRVGCARERFPSPWPPWWDDRGELLIRYGAPDSRATFIGGEDGPNREVWHYDRLHLAFELEDVQLSDEFRLTLQRGREIRRFDQGRETAIDFGVPIRPWGSNDPSPTDFGVPDFQGRQAASDFRRLVDRGAQTLAAYPEIYLHDYGGEWLPVAFDAVGFASSEPGLTRLEVHTGIRAGDLTFERKDGLWTAVLDVEAVAKTPDYREVARTRKLTRDRRESVDDLQDRLVLDGTALLLEPGTYRLAIAVRDTTSRRIGTFQREVEVPAFPPGTLAVSGIQTAFRIGSAEPGAPFRKGDLQVAPWPLTKFPRGRDVHLYFEIYGLTPSPAGDVLFAVDMLLQPRGPEKSGWFGTSKGRARTGVATSWEGRGRGPVAREHFALETGTIGPGTFDLRITVTDRVGEAVAERWTSVTVSE